MMQINIGWSVSSKMRNIQLLLFCVFGTIKCQLYTNPFQLQSLFMDFMELGQNVKSLTIDFKSKPKIVKDYDQFNLDIDGEMTEDKVLDTLVSNAVHVFQLVYSLRLLYQDMKIIETSEENTQRITTKIREMRSIKKWPTNEDLEGVILALCKIQHTYRVSILDLAKGIIGRHKTHAYLTSEDCFKIAQSQMQPKIEFFALAIEWAEAALTLCTLDDHDDDITEFLKVVKSKHDKDIKSSVWKTHPGEKYFHTLTSNYSGVELRMAEDEINRFDLKKSGATQKPSFYLLCNGMVPEPLNLNSCELRHNDDPWLKIGPIKTELLQVEEDQFELTLFHDFLGSQEINSIINISQKMLDHAKVALNAVEQKSNQGLTKRARTQSVAWIDEDREIITCEKISRRLEHLLKLDVAWEVDHHASEPYQVGVYSPGGYFGPHTDSVSSRPVEVNYKRQMETMGHYIGNRLATAMFYVSKTSCVVAKDAFIFYNLLQFSEVDEGKTVFRKGISVTPEKGSMLFWNNINHLGESIEQAWHTGCPTLYGIKWGKFF